MPQLKTNVSDIKNVAKNLAQSLQKDMEFKISHSAALNLASRSLGFANYNTYKAEDEAKSTEEYSKVDNTLGSRSWSEIEKEVKINRLKQYPSIDNKFIKFAKSTDYDIFIYEEDNIHFLLFRLKNNSTGRIFFNPRYESFSLFVYPDIKTAFNSYDISIQNIPNNQLNHKYFHVTKHLLRSKKWIEENLEIMDDLFTLMEAVKQDRKWFQEVLKEHSEEKLRKFWQSKKDNIL